jgi:HD-GYP domain-containing protein (c-di-GMP phosphodiesterase class II)
VRLTVLTRAVGLTLARDLPATGPGAIPLLRAGAVVSERYERALAAAGIHAVWVHDELSAGIEPAELLPEAVRAETATRVQRALESAREAFVTAQPLALETLQDLAAIVDRIATGILDNPGAALALHDLANADQYTHRHSVNVAALGLLLARAQFRRDGWIDYRGQRRYDRLNERLSQLGMGLLLHDIGKMAVPDDVLNKPGPLDEQEWDIMRTHPDAGVALLNSRSMSPLVKTVIRDHHERFDGSGYPRGLPGEDIHQFARIAAVADVYDAVTSARPYKDAEPAHVGVGVIAGGRGTAFDPEVVDTFRRIVFPHPVGTEIDLADGRTGVVARVDPDRPDEPVVRLPGPDGTIEVRVDTRTELAALVG